MRHLFLGLLCGLFIALSCGYVLSSSPSDTLPSGVSAVCHVTSERSNVFPIDLNTATADMLDTLPGIGLARASNIIAYRDRNGFFLTTEEIQNVPGIGPGIYEKIASMITVNLPSVS